MDWLGVFMIVVGLYWFISTIVLMAGSGRPKTVFGWFWEIGFCLLGVYLVVHGYMKVTAPPPGLLSAVPGMAGGRRKWY